MQMEILLIEDDDYKAEQIQKFVTKEKHQIVLSKSFQSGMRAIMSKEFDLLVLDMSIPTFDTPDPSGANRHRPFGGKDVLQELKRIEKTIPVVVMTQYSVFGEGRDNISLQQLDQILREEYKDIYKGMIYFDGSSMDWSIKLKDELERLNG